MTDFTFIVGAGASAEFGLPIGEALKSQISDVLKPQSTNGTVRDQNLQTAIQNLAGYDALKIRNYYAATRHISSSIHQSISIDNFINSHRGDEIIEQCGKLAIAKCILDAERSSKIFIDRYASWNDRKGSINFGEVSNTWLNGLFKVLSQDCPISELKERLSRVCFIVFNYDRCIEHFLYHAISNFYRVTLKEAADTLLHLEVLHPYGTLSKLSWQHTDFIDYGAETDAGTLIKASRNILTFSESVLETSSDRERIREVVSNSSNNVFIGFGYIPLNMKLLRTDKQVQNVNCNSFGTCLGISNYDKERVLSEIASLSGGQRDLVNLSSCKAGELFGEYTRGLCFV